MKYYITKLLKDFKDYIEYIHSKHTIVDTHLTLQAQDLLWQLVIAKDFWQTNAFKYLARYGKKNGRNRKDLLKAKHYIILLMSSEDKDNGESEHETKQCDNWCT